VVTLKINYDIAGVIAITFTTTSSSADTTTGGNQRGN
jgi:hypothetical protein